MPVVTAPDSSASWSQVSRGQWCGSPPTPTSPSACAWPAPRTSAWVTAAGLEPLRGRPGHPTSATRSNPAVVLTSGLDDSVMPGDIPIGLVDRSDRRNAGMQLLLVDFAVGFSQLDVVQVLKWTPPR